MRNKLNIDIILPVYNSQRFIKKTINSVLNQTFKSWKLIIIDDGSTDSTYEVLNALRKKIKKRKKIIILRNNINKGQGFSRNRGLNYSKSKFVAFLDSDDTWHKNKLKNQIEFMSINNYDFTYTDYKITNNKRLDKAIHVPDFFNYKSFINNSSITTSSMILNRKIIKNIYFKNFRFLEDYYFKCQILRNNILAHRFPGTYTRYLIRKDSLQSNRFLVLSSLWIINKNFNKMSFFENLYSILCIVVNSFKKYGFR